VGGPPCPLDRAPDRATAASVSAPAGPIWPSLRAAAHAFCPPFEVANEDPGRLVIDLRDPSGQVLRLRYRSERGLFLRTYFLVVEAELPGFGPAEPGELVLRRRKLRWKRPRPRGGERWTESFGSSEIRSALKGVPAERLTLQWQPNRASWRLALETLLGSVTVTFFPALMTPNPLKPDEAQAMIALVAALRHPRARTPA
jgi:hypothetical protein